MIDSNLIVRVPSIVCTPGRAVLYDEYLYSDKPVRLSNLLRKQISLTGSRAHISKRSTSKIKKAVEYITTFSPRKTVYDQATNKSITFQLTFITLTLSSNQIHTDNDVKKMLLHQFITEVTNKYSVKYYLWRIEKQLNGNAHIHFICNKFIPYYELRVMWNRIQNKLGYVDRYRDNMRDYYKDGFRLSDNKYDKRDYKTQFEAYKRGLLTDYQQPNSTDIHKIFNITNLAAYVSKYMSKNNKDHYVKVKSDNNIKHYRVDDNSRYYMAGVLRYLRKQCSRGRLWGCNAQLSSLTGASSEVDSSIREEIERLKKDKEVWFYRGDYFACFYFDMQTLISNKCLNIFNLILNDIIDKVGYKDEYLIDSSTNRKEIIW
jgi:hypothetical protein